MKYNFKWMNLGMVCIESDSRQGGFILVLLLLFVFMIGLFALTLHHHLQITLRIQQNYQNLLQQFYAVEAVLMHAEGLLQKQEVIDHQLYREKYGEYTVFYYFKRLPWRFCFQKQRAYYYRITAYLPDLPEQEVSSIKLQSTYAQASMQLCHDDEMPLMQLGRSSWRALNH